MSNKSIKIKQLYRELRSTLDESVASVEVLRLAAAILDNHVRENKPAKDGSYSERRSFDEYSLCEAFADGGWRVMYKETNWLNALFDDDTPMRSNWNFLQSYQKWELNYE